MTSHQNRHRHERPCRRSTHSATEFSRIVLRLFLLVFLAAASSAVHAQESTAPAAWRVECGGDGKTLTCNAVQLVVQRENRQLIAQLSVRVPADTKTPVMMIQLPLGLNLAEPLQIKIDNGPPERQQIQTCTATGCFVGMTLNDKMLASMRSGSQFTIVVQDSGKRNINIELPLLGFGLALDKAK